MSTQTFRISPASLVKYEATLENGPGTYFDLQDWDTPALIFAIEKWERQSRTASPSDRKFLESWVRGGRAALLAKKLAGVP